MSDGKCNNLYEFGDFRLDMEKCLLWRGDRLVSLSPKALELLCLLVKRQGEIVSKQEIFENVWAETFVEEGVLTQNIYTLRQTLGGANGGSRIIENIARRGYRLTVPVKSLSTKTNGEIRVAAPAAVGTKSREFVLATETRTEIIEEEFFAESADAPKLISGKTPFYRKKSAVFMCAGLILALLGAFAGYRFLRPQIWSYFHPPLENVQFQKLTDTGNVLDSALSPDGNFMAFVKENGIFLKDIKSGRDIRLDVPNVQSFGSLQFAPGGDYIFFRNHPTLRKPANVLQVSRFGGETKIVAEKVWLSFGLSPDGKQMAFIRNFPERQKQILYVKNLETGDEREVLTRNFPETFFHRGALAWSPDAAKIAFVANAATERTTRLFVANVQNGETEEIKTPRLRRFEQAAWLPDGETLIVSASEPQDRKFHLWKIFYPSGYIQRVTNGLNSFDSISISADGKKILTNQTAENSNLWTADQTDLNDQKQITSGNSNNFGQTSLAWANNEKLVYAAVEEKNSFANVWTLDLTSGARQPLTANTQFHSDFASVSADGKFVYFNSNRNRLVNVWRIDASGENLTQITDAREGGLQLFPQPAPDAGFIYYIFRNRDAAVIKRWNLAEKREEIFLENKEISPAAFLSLSADGKRLAFLNLKGEIERDDEESNFQFAVVSTENAADIRFFNVKSIGSVAHLTADGKFFDYISFSEGSTKILRQSVDDAGAEAREILSLPKERIFNFAWSKDGTKLALSRGRRLRDAVLLTNFD